MTDSQRQSATNDKPVRKMLEPRWLRMNEAAYSMTIRCENYSVLAGILSVITRTVVLLANSGRACHKQLFAPATMFSSELQFSLRSTQLTWLQAQELKPMLENLSSWLGDWDWSNRNAATLLDYSFYLSCEATPTQNSGKYIHALRSLASYFLKL